MRVRFRPGFVRAAAAALLLGAALLCGLCAPTRAQAQATRPDSARADTVRTDTARVDTARTDTAQADTARTDAARTDSLQAAGADSLGAGATRSGAGPPGGAGPPAEAGNAVQFSARDSLVIVFEEDDPGDMGTLYGEAEVVQQEATLSAYEVQILFERGRLRAVGPPAGVPADSAGLPQFQRGEGESFTGSELSFDLETRRGRVVEARTPFQEGYVEGQTVRVEEDSTLFIRDGLYTTCDCPRGETPSYSLRSDKMKVQGKWVYTGPIQLFLYSIPTPLILPFAFLPSTSGRHGGIIPPSYGRDDRRGFYLRDFGYYWPISDYMDLQVTGSLWSRGSWAVSPTFRYSRRYYYDGNLQVDYVRNLAGDIVDADRLNETESKIRWTHSQQFVPSGAPNSSSLNANVDLASRTYRRAVSDDFEDNVTQKTSSSVNFRKKWNDGNQRLQLRLSQQQNLSSGNANLTLPSLSFDQNSLQPFKRERRGPGEEERWYEKITTSYTGSVDNTFDFVPLSDEERRARADTAALVANGDTTEGGEISPPSIAWYNALFSQEDYRRATGDPTQRFDFSARHNIPVSASFRLPRYQLNVTPSLNYSERWFPNTTRIETEVTERDSATGAVTDFRTIEREEAGFFAQREFNFSMGASTTFYGLFPLRAGPLEGLRQTVQPRLSFSYAPDYRAGFFGRERTYTNPETGEAERYDIVGGGRLPREQRNVNFSVDNVFETKEVRIDSTGAEQSETLRLMRLSASSSYNLAAEERPLSDVRVGARFPVLQEKYNISTRANLTFSPYAFGENGERLNRTVLRETRLFPAQLTDFDLTVSTDFQGGDESAGRGGGAFDQRRAAVDRSTGGAPQVPDPMPRDVPGRPSIRQGVGQYANFAIPWSLDLRLTYGFTNRERFEQSNFLLNADFDFNLTPRWKVSGRSGYDFNQSKLTSTRFNITRDFDCWQMAFTWTPFGRYESYSFNLYVKSSTLRDLLNLRIPREDVRDRFRGVVSQATR